MNTSPNQPNTNNSDETGASTTPKLAKQPPNSKSLTLVELIDDIPAYSDNAKKIKAELKVAIDHKIAQEANKARIDELERLYDPILGENGDPTNNVIGKRIKELQQKGTK